MAASLMSSGGYESKFFKGEIFNRKNTIKKKGCLEKEE